MVESSIRPEKNGALTLTQDQYFKLSQGEKINTKLFSAKMGGKGNKTHIEYDLKEGAPHPYIFLHQPYASINRVPAIQPSESLGNARKLRFYEEGQPYKVNGSDYKSELWAKHGRKWYPVSTFYNAYTHQAAIFVPPVK